MKNKFFLALICMISLSLMASNRSGKVFDRSGKGSRPKSRGDATRMTRLALDFTVSTNADIQDLRSDLAQHRQYQFQDIDVLGRRIGSLERREKPRLDVLMSHKQGLEGLERLCKQQQDRLNTQQDRFISLEDSLKKLETEFSLLTKKSAAQELEVDRLKAIIAGLSKSGRAEFFEETGSSEEGASAAKVVLVRTNALAVPVEEQKIFKRKAAAGRSLESTKRGR